MKNEDKYKVYCHINKINNKRYYGITMQDINKRWTNGRTYKPKNKNHNSRFYNAILKYGWDNFEHIVLFDDLNKKEAEDLERELIQKYNTTNSNYGYNIQSGGNSKGRNTDEIRKRISEGRKKKVLQIDKKDYSIIKIWNSGEEASESLGIPHSNISKCLNKERISAGGYIWRFKKDYDDIEAINDLISEEIKEYKNKHKRKISINTLKKAHEATSKKVIQIDKDTKEIIAHYNSISEASRITGTGISGISKVCINKRGSAGGYIWIFLEDYLHIKENNLTQSDFILYMTNKYENKNSKKNDYQYKERKFKKIVQLDLDCNFIKTWDKSKHIEDELGVKVKRISDICRGRRKSAKGYIFIYLDDYNEIKDCNYNINEMYVWKKKTYNT